MDSANWRAEAQAPARARVAPRTSCSSCLTEAASCIRFYWDYIRVVLGLYWDYIRVILGLYEGYIRVILGLYWGIGK